MLLNMFKPCSDLFADRFFCGLFLLFTYDLYLCINVITSSEKGRPFGSFVLCHFPNWCSESVMVLDYIDS